MWVGMWGNAAMWEAIWGNVGGNVAGMWVYSYIKPLA